MTSVIQSSRAQVRRRPRLIGLVFGLSVLTQLGCSLDDAGLGPTDVTDDEPGAGGARLDAGRGLKPVVDDNGAGNSDASIADAAISRAMTDAGSSGTCSLAGTFAMRVEFDLSWEGTRTTLRTPVIAAGSGTLSVDALASVRERGGQYEAQIKPCGTSIPDFQASLRLPILGQEQYGVYVPTASWDKPNMPSWPVTWMVSCNQPHCAIESSVLDAWVGGASRDPGVAPTSPDQVEPIDVDGDRQPGLTVWTRGPDELTPFGIPYTQPQLNLRGRATRLMVAMRMRSHFGGQLESCDALSGESNDAEVSAYAVGCMTGPAPEVACDKRTVDTLDQYLPTWNVRAARYFSTRIAEPTCAAVRAQLNSGAPIRLSR